MISGALGSLGFRDSDLGFRVWSFMLRGVSCLRGNVWECRVLGLAVMVKVCRTPIKTVAIASEWDTGRTPNEPH